MSDFHLGLLRIQKSNQAWNEHSERDFSLSQRYCRQHAPTNLFIQPRRPGRQVPSFEKIKNLDPQIALHLAVEEMRKLHAHGETNPDAAAAAIEVAALVKWPKD